jgi:hypothetical protein
VFGLSRLALGTRGSRAFWGPRGSNSGRVNSPNKVRKSRVRCRWSARAVSCISRSPVTRRLGRTDHLLGSRENSPQGYLAKTHLSVRPRASAIRFPRRFEWPGPDPCQIAIVLSACLSSRPRFADWPSNSHLSFSLRTRSRQTAASPAREPVLHRTLHRLPANSDRARSHARLRTAAPRGERRRD